MSQNIKLILENFGSFPSGGDYCRRVWALMLTFFIKFNSACSHCQWYKSQSSPPRLQEGRNFEQSEKICQRWYIRALCLVPPLPTACCNGVFQMCQSKEFTKRCTMPKFGFPESLGIKKNAKLKFLKIKSLGAAGQTLF